MRALFDRSTNGKTVVGLAAKDAFDKEIGKLNNLKLNDLELKVCGRVYAETVCCFSVSVV